MNTPLRVLIVEDRPTTVMAIKESLEQTGYWVCGDAANHKSAIALMKSESPDLAIIDIGLEGQPDGIVTAEELVRIKPIPFFYLTVLTDDVTYERAKKTNPVAFLYKPFRPREIARQIDLALHNYYEGNKADLTTTSDYLYIPNGTSKFRIHISRIIYIEADGSYAKLFLTKEELGRLDKKTNSLVVSIGLSNTLTYLPDNFCKLSRSIAININYLERFDASQLILNGCEKPIPMPEGGQKKLLNKLNVMRSRQQR